MMEQVIVFLLNNFICFYRRENEFFGLLIFLIFSWRIHFHYMANADVTSSPNPMLQAHRR